MELPKALKSKKLLLVVAVLVVVSVGFFALKFMTSGGDQTESEKPRSAQRTAKKIPKPKTEEPDKSPLFEAMEALRDPFHSEDPKAAELKDKLDMTKKEVEYLKAILEEKKLKQEIRDIEKSLAEEQGLGAAGDQVAILPPSSDAKAQDRPRSGLLVKAILITDEKRSALLASGDKKTWVHEGEHFDGWKIREIREGSVVVLKKGRTFVFFYDRPTVGLEGES